MNKCRLVEREGKHHFWAPETIPLLMSVVANLGGESLNPANFPLAHNTVIVIVLYRRNCCG